MSLEFTFTCPLPNGVHARPASALEEVTSCFGAEIILTNARTGRAANAKSVLAIVGADIRLNDECRIKVSGPDEQDAMAALSSFVTTEFPHCDEALPPVVHTNGVHTLSPALNLDGANVKRGTPVVGGIGRGRVVRCGGLHVPDAIAMTGATDFVSEVRRLDTALSALAANFEERLTRHAPRVELDLMRAHRSVARDPEFRAQLHEALHRQGRTAAGAIADTEAHFTRMLLASESALLRERALDLQDVCSQLLRQIYGKAAAPPELRLTENSIVMAESLTPGQLLRLDREYLKGLVLGHAGTTSHTVILARSFGIPTLIGMTDLASTRWDGMEAILDADVGLLVTGLGESVRRYYQKEEKRLAERRARQHQFASRPGVTSDGHGVEIAGNITTSEEASAAFDAGAEGIGLFRTEMLFLDRDTPPSEDEQVEDYRRVLAAANGRPAIIRTLDIGGDKPFSYLNLPAEDNPLIGYRAIRVYPEFESIFRTQIRALVRASKFGRIKVLVPMVTSLDEVRWVKRIVREEQAACTAAGIEFDEAMPLGAMIEVPAAAFLLDQLSRELDFFSIGTNDLLQCFAAADRSNPRLSKIYDPLQPAFLRILKKIVDDVHANGKWAGLCGEMGARPDYLPLLVGLGLEEISAAPAALPALKATLANWSRNDCRELARQALACGTADEVRRVLDNSSSINGVAIVEPDMILAQSDSVTKAEAIKEVVDQLFVMGRTDQPRMVEQAVWSREAVYSTGFGHGFAIPHCKTNAISANSVVLLKLQRPVAWESLDSQPVGVIMLLAMRETDQANGHMKIFSSLARKVMHEEFRDRLLKEHDPVALCSFLKQSLQVEGNGH